MIENLPWAEFITRYDRSETLFYLDPPYWGSEDFYGRDLFPKAAFAALADVLERIAGRFILSVNDVPETRAIFGRFTLVEADVTYTVAGGTGKRSSESIVTNERCA